MIHLREFIAFESHFCKIENMFYFAKLTFDSDNLSKVDRNTSFVAKFILLYSQL